MFFRRYGRSYHLQVTGPEDLKSVLELDDSLWVATGAPIDGLNFDPVLLDLLDSDRNRRIMCFEIRDAVEWLLKTLKDVSGVASASTTLRLDSVNADDPDGRKIRVSIEKMLRQLGRADSPEITLDQIRAIKKKVQEAPVSGAGVVLPDAASDPEIREFLSDIVDCLGGADHPSGKRGVSQAQLDDFLGQASKYLEWHARGTLPDANGTTDIMPFGDKTAASFDLFGRLKRKIDQYFAQCQAASFDPRAAEYAKIGAKRFEETDISDPAQIERLLADAPLALPTAGNSLNLKGNINPAYGADLARFTGMMAGAGAVKAAMSLTREDWIGLKRLFEPHEKWKAAKAGASVEKAGIDKLRRYLDDKFGDAVRRIIAESDKAAVALDNASMAEKLALYQGNMIAVTNNFVSFPDLYNPRRTAAFEAGGLTMDGRHFRFSMKVADRAEHSKVAVTSNMFLMYVEISGGDGRKYEVAVPVTSGGKGNLCVGKRGIFEDVAGAQWSARVVQVIENPISVREALVSPFHRLGRMLSGKIEAITSGAEKKFDAAAGGIIEGIDKPVPAAAPAQSKGLLAGGLLMGGGVAVAAIGSAIAYMARTVAGLGLPRILAAVGIAVAAVLIPIAVTAFIRLGKRDLSAIMEGAGWAINARMRLSFEQGRVFTFRPRYPRDAGGIRRVWPVLVWLAIAAAAAGLSIWAWSAAKDRRANAAPERKPEIVAEPAGIETKPADATPGSEPVAPAGSAGGESGAR